MSNNHHAPARGMIGPRINCASRMLRHMFNDAAKEEGLFAGQQHIILALFNNEGITVGEIARQLDITPATVSVSIKRLEKSGFVKKQADDTNARITKLYLTDKGRKIPDRIRERMDSQEKYITMGLTDEQRNMFSDMLDTVINNMKNKEGFDD